MGIFLPFFSATTHAVGTVLDKLNFNLTKIHLSTLMVLVFGSMFTTLTVITVVAKPEPPNFTPQVCVILGAVLVISFFQNILEFKGIQSMELHAREPISNLSPILTAVIAYVVFPSDQNSLYLIAIALGVLIIYATNFHRHSWRSIGTFGAVYVFGDILLGALYENIAAFGVGIISPVYIALFRMGGILILSLVFFKTDWRHVPRKSIALGLSSGILFGVASLAKLFSMQALGLSFTVLVMLIGPGLIYILSRLVLNEKVELRQVIGSAAIIAMVVAIEYW